MSITYHGNTMGTIGGVSFAVPIPPNCGRVTFDHWAEVEKANERQYASLAKRDARTRRAYRRGGA